MLCVISLFVGNRCGLFMKILFVETREKTGMFLALAQALNAEGIDSGFLLQNKFYRSQVSCFNTFFIGYPKKNKLCAAGLNYFEVIAKSDRAVQYFNKNTDHYEYYHREIKKVLNEFKPDLVIGENSLFHARLCSHLCREMGILYLDPVVTRYPSGRFTFNLYDTLEIYGGAGDALDEEGCSALINSVVNKKIRPFYMARPSIKRKARLLWRKVVAASAFYFGEKYNTPSLLIKRKLERDLKFQLKRWQVCCDEKKLVADKINVLYPMHMQPEQNIDVWGAKYSNQVELLKALLRKLDDRFQILVKLNPKAKYELSRELVDLVVSEPRLVPIPLGTGMEEVRGYTDCVITVAGTIAIECIFSGSPVVLLTDLINAEFACLRKVSSLADVNLSQLVIDLINRSVFEKEKVIAYIQDVYKVSFPGLISDPVHYPASVTKENIDKLKNALLSVIQDLT